MPKWRNFAKYGHTVLDVKLIYLVKLVQMTPDASSDEIEAMKCSLNGTHSFNFGKRDFDRFNENLHFRREGKIGFLPRNEQKFDKIESR